jgi:hypothetical protein
MKNSNKGESFYEEIRGTTSEIISQVKKLIKEGNARRVIIQNKDGKVLFQSQLMIGLGGAALLAAIAPILSAIGMFAMIMNDVKIIVERYPDAPKGSDEYSVDAEIIEIRGEEEAETSSEKQTSEDKTKEQEETGTEKTVGKKGDKE